MCFLKIAGTDLRIRDMGCDGHDRGSIAMAVKQSIDEVQITWSATPRAYRHFAGHLSLCTRGKRCHFLMANRNPLNLVTDAERLSDAIERISYKPVNSLHIGSL